MGYLRKIMKIGKYSLGIGIPKVLLQKLNWNHKDILYIEILNNGLFIRKENN